MRRVDSHLHEQREVSVLEIYTNLRKGVPFFQRTCGAPAVSMYGVISKSTGIGACMSFLSPLFDAFVDAEAYDFDSMFCTMLSARMKDEAVYVVAAEAAAARTGRAIFTGLSTKRRLFGSAKYKG